MERKHYLLNYFFLSGLIVLFLNDHVFKYEFGNWLTGKLSDFAGVFILPFFLSYLFPQKEKHNIFLTAVFFVWWKSPLSQGFIDGFNSLGLFKVARIIDYTDLIALVTLPFTFGVFRQMESKRTFRINTRVSAIFVLLPALLVLTATSVIRPHGSGNLLLRGASHMVKMAPDSIILILHKNGIRAYRDTLYLKQAYGSNDSGTTYIREAEDRFFKIDELVLGKDTLRSVQFNLFPRPKGKTLITVTSVDMPRGVDVTKIHPYVRKITKKYLRQTF